jgi:hypothetical protein
MLRHLSVIHRHAAPHSQSDTRPNASQHSGPETVEAAPGGDRHRFDASSQPGECSSLRRLGERTTQFAAVSFLSSTVNRPAW